MTIPLNSIITIALV